MAVHWGMTLWMANMVWIALRGWVSSCFTVADEVAGSIRTGDIGPFHTLRKTSNAEKENIVFMEDPNSCLISVNIDVLYTDLAYQFTKLHFDVFGQLHQKIYAAGLVFLY
ncbi:hypothetical protein EZV62_005083 [Acer yangbiense]|uniref:Secreted protein n=1 Tax=Acer yangbiense TaxID=1000413 RepID=A0A5C7ILV4_9ROSI|nr:hypothetical protein EZV62_005083 [Acer yangbiense]